MGRRGIASFHPSWPLFLANAVFYSPRRLQAEVAARDHALANAIFAPRGPHPHFRDPFVSALL